ncbi:putative O-glycosylation ligase, exosortase A system-associated [Methylotuvimicrobium buryatense]|uniref:O-glycosylation ligase, exosortase A system-associated n=1 Tax=Methylotuvimicrobium buryatense TaxID=95641 RepID=A0A4V1IJN1_METBY|nr:putative O-glycosylation ligase, exosortase A system-associated [Methylotuvimicrobium buryatense]QCW81985.1 putative O-glycosylation ligase, exosortase A system-associated [Methylotuvimicrobium buryatense]
MRDIVVLIFLICCILAAIKKPWWGVLSLAIFSYLNPHAYAWGFVRSLPVYYVLFLVVAFRTFTTKDRQSVPSDWRVIFFVLLWLYFGFTSTQAYAPFVWQEYWNITKIYLPFIFTLILINTREKLYYLIITIGLSIGVVAVKGGIWAILTGFGNRVYGPPNTQFFDNNQFAVAMLMIIPFLLLWRNESSHHLIKKGVLFSIPIIYLASLSSWSRGALLTMTALTLMLVWNSKHKLLSIPLVVIGVFAIIPYLPEEWFGRMHTIETYEQDGSAMGRIEVWIDGWNHTLKHPFTGGGFGTWWFITKRDFHSSYVRMFAEHGFVAFGIWLSMILGTVWNLTFLPKKMKKYDGMEWVGNYCFALRTSLICYMIGTAFLGLCYWDLLYHLIFISVLVKKFALEEIANRDSVKSHQRKLYSYTPS